MVSKIDIKGNNTVIKNLMECTTLFVIERIFSSQWAEAQLSVGPLALFIKPIVPARLESLSIC